MIATLGLESPDVEIEVLGNLERTPLLISFKEDQIFLCTRLGNESEYWYQSPPLKENTAYQLDVFKDLELTKGYGKVTEELSIRKGTSIFFWFY